MKKIKLKSTTSELLDALLATEHELESLKDDMQFLVHRMQDALGVDDIEMGIDAAHVLLSQMIVNRESLDELRASAA